MTLTIRAAKAADAAQIVAFIRALAAYEKLEHEVKAREADITRDLFGADPKVFCEIAEWDGRPVGFALWFGKGIGKALLVHLARRCVAEGLGRLEWWVLDWNEPSIAFYKAQGGAMQDEWTKVRVDGEDLLRLGA